MMEFSLSLFFENDYRLSKREIRKIAVDMKAKQERTWKLVDASLSTFRESNALSKIWHYSS